MVQPVRPFGMAVAEAEHEEIVDGRERRLQPLGAVAEHKRRRRRMTRAALPVHLRRRIVEFARGAIVRRPDGAVIPRQAGRVVIGVKKKTGGFEIGRRPQPEELRHDCRRQRLRIAQADRPDTPRPVARENF